VPDPVLPEKNPSTKTGGDFLCLMVIISDEQGYASEGDGEFKDKDIDVIHNRLIYFKG
jgi:hypothetical protein